MSKLHSKRSSSSSSSTSSSSSSSTRSSRGREKEQKRKKKSLSQERRERERELIKEEEMMEQKNSKKSSQLYGHRGYVQNYGRERNRDRRSRSQEYRIKNRRREHSPTRSRSRERKKRKEYRSRSKDRTSKVKRKEKVSYRDIPRDSYIENKRISEKDRSKSNSKVYDSKLEDNDNRRKEKDRSEKHFEKLPKIDSNDKEYRSEKKKDIEKSPSQSSDEKEKNFKREKTKEEEKIKKSQRGYSKEPDDQIDKHKKKSSKSKRKRSLSSDTTRLERKEVKKDKANLASNEEEGLKSKIKQSISEEANIDELQKMKEQLQQELDKEKVELMAASDNEDLDKREYKEQKQISEKSRHSSKRKYYESDDNYNAEKSTSHKMKQAKLSDTYWNKYADKLGIQVNNSEWEKEGNHKNIESLKHPKTDLSPDMHAKEKDYNYTKNKASVFELIKKPVLDPLSTRTGGAYIPPAKLKMMQDQITDKSSQAFQRLSWEALKKSINGLVNKINVSNIKILVRELFKENVIRGRGVLCRSLMQAQAFSPTFTHVYAALVAVINSKFPQIGELLLHRLIMQFRRGVKRNDKNSCIASCKFLAHLINQQVAHEVVALEILTMLLEKAKDIIDESESGEKSRHSSVELAIVFLKDCGMKLSELTPKGLMIIMETLRNILHEGKLDARYKYMIEVLMAIHKESFKDFPSVIEELDLVEEGEQFTHIVELDGKLNTDDILNVFKLDTDYEENEKKYKELKASILGDSDDEANSEDSGSEGDAENSDSNEEESDIEENKDEENKPILDRTEGNLIAFRRTVYLTIQSSLDVDECAHKLLKGEIKPGWEEELCNMIIDCCAQQRTYIKFYGLLAQRFCMINKSYQEPFESIFKDAYETCHRLEIEKLRNVAKLYAHLFFSDAISWEVLSCVHLNQDETTSSSRVFLKILFEELANFMGLCKLNERLREPTLSHAFEGLLPRDNPVNTRFAINFFTTIGLGGLTDDLREFLRSQPKPTAVVAPVPHTKEESGSSSTDSSSSSSSTSSSGSSSSNSSDSSSSSSSSSDSDSDSDSSSDSSSEESSSSSNGSSSDSSSDNSSSSSSDSSSSNNSASKDVKAHKRKKTQSSTKIPREKEQKQKKKQKQRGSKTPLSNDAGKKKRHENYASKKRSSKVH